MIDSREFYIAQMARSFKLVGRYFLVDIATLKRHDFFHNNQIPYFAGPMDDAYLAPNT